MTRSQRIWVIVAFAWVALEFLLAFLTPPYEFVLPILGVGTIVIASKLLLMVRDK